MVAPLETRHLLSPMPEYDIGNLPNLFFVSPKYNYMCNLFPNKVDKSFFIVEKSLNFFVTVLRNTHYYYDTVHTR